MANLTKEDMVAIAAYVTSRPPVAEPAASLQPALRVSP
jgi:hypothetical protein